MLHIALAGAGIGGLAAGLALAQSGCRVSIFERAPVLAEVGAGLQLSPNANAALRRLGVLARVERDAVAPLSLRIGRGRDGTVLARLPLGRHAEDRFGAPFLLTLRADLQRALRESIQDNPHVTIETGKGIANWRVAGDRLMLEFDGDRPVVAVNGLVGCDGLHSVVRERLGFAPTPEPGRGGRTAWRATIDASEAPAPFRRPNANLWLGHKVHLVHYPVASGRLVNVIAAIDDSRPGDRADAFWSAPGDPVEIEQRFASWADPIRQLLAAPKAWGKWPLIDRPPLGHWSQGRVTLLGDAAHPMLPFLAQGAAQAIEDAAALGDAVLAHPHDPAVAFRAYEAVRLRRTARIQAESRRQAVIYHLPPPASAVRDLVLRCTPANKLLARYDWLYST